MSLTLNGPSGPLPWMSGSPSVGSVILSAGTSTRRLAHTRRTRECVIGEVATTVGLGLGSCQMVLSWSSSDPSYLHQGSGRRWRRLRHVRLPAGRHPAGPGRHPGWGSQPDVGAEVPDPAARPTGHAASGCPPQPWRKAGGLLRDLHAAVRPAGPACRSARHHGVGVRRRGVEEQARPADPPRALADGRGRVGPSGAGEVDQRPGGRARELPAAPAAGGPHAALGEPTGRAGRVATSGRRSTRRRGATPARFRW